MAEKKNQRTVKELRQEQMTTKRKGHSSGNEKAKPRLRKKQKCENTSSEDEEWSCLICGEPSENKHSGLTSIGAYANLSMLTTLKYCLAQGPIVL